MKARRRLAIVALGVAVIVMAATPYVLPGLVRRIAISQIGALTQRPVSIERVDLGLLTGRATVHGFRLAERDGQTPFADVRRLDLRLHLPSLLRGQLWVREVVVTGSTVRVIRLPGGGFNLSDLIQDSGSTGRVPRVTVDHLAVREGTVTLEDRALREPRTWRSEQIMIEAHDLSTRGDAGRAVGRSVIAGAPVSVEISHLRLYPVRLQATVTVEGLDVTPAGVYLPPHLPAVLDRGRVSSTVRLALDAREGLQVDAMGRFDDVVVVSRDAGQPLALVPRLTTRIDGFAIGEDGQLRLAQLALDGIVRVRDPRPSREPLLRDSRVRASVANLTWPATAPGTVDLRATIPDAGALTMTGTIRPPPAPSQLRLRVANLHLAPWTQWLPLNARVTGVTEADLRMNEPLTAGLPARLRGSITVKGLAVADARQDVLGIRRLEASGLEIHWPSRVVVNRIVLSSPHAVVERDRTGAFPVADLLGRPAASPMAATAATKATSPPDPLAIEVGAILVRDGAIGFRDQTTSPAARLDVGGITGSITGAGWPPSGPAVLRVALTPPGGGRVQLTGRVGLDPLTAEMRVVARHTELAPYQPYLPMAARIDGRADVDIAVVVPSIAEGRATARGRAALARVEVRDGQRTVMRLERADATGIDVQWPERIAVGRLALARPWIVLERDDKGAFPLRTLVAVRRAGAGSSTALDASPDRPDARPLPIVRVSQLDVDGGGMRLVDRAVSPAFAIDAQPLTLRAQGLATASDHAARVELAGELGPGAALRVHGTLGPLADPLRFDLRGEVRQFAIPRANPYVLQQAGWKSLEGRLTSTFRARLERQALSARTDIWVSRLQLARAAPADGAHARIGLPLDMLTALMKDRRGDITLSLPVTGTLNDPRFDFGEALWSAVRTVAINAITLPVSWIGRVRFTPDSRIERIEIDPVAFEAGTSTLTPEGHLQAARLAAFLDRLPHVSVTLTPVVSAQDVTVLKRQALDAAIEALARQERLSREAAADALESRPGGLLDRPPVPAGAMEQLAGERVETVRTAVKAAGIDPARLPASEVVEREPGARVELGLVAPESERPSKLQGALRKLIGKD